MSLLQSQSASRAALLDEAARVEAEMDAVLQADTAAYLARRPDEAAKMGRGEGFRLAFSERSKPLRTRLLALRQQIAAARESEPEPPASAPPPAAQADVDAAVKAALADFYRSAPAPVQKEATPVTSQVFSQADVDAAIRKELGLRGLTHPAASAQRTPSPTLPVTMPAALTYEQEVEAAAQRIVASSDAAPLRLADADAEAVAQRIINA